MSAYHVTFTGEIERVAAGLGRAPTPQQVAVLDEVLKTLTEIDTEAGTVTVEGEPISTYLARKAGHFAPIETTSTPDPAGMVLFKLNNSTSYRKRDDAMVRITEGLKAADDAALAREVATWPNPFAKGQENRTRQVIL